MGRLRKLKIRAGNLNLEYECSIDEFLKIISDFSGHTKEPDFSISPLKLVNSHHPEKLTPFPKPEEIAAYIESKGGNFTFTMGELSSHFFNKDTVYNKSNRGSYDRFWSRVWNARKILERKHKGKFVSSKMNVNGKLKTIYKFQKSGEPG